MSIAPSSALASANVHMASGLYTLKKANDAQGEAVLQLLQSLPQSQSSATVASPTSSNPPNLGQNIDLRA